MKFYIFKFYLFISKDNLINAINFVKSIAPIDDKIMKTVLYASKSLLLNKNEV